MKKRTIDETGRKPNSSGIGVIKRVRGEPGPAETIVSETDDMVKELAKKQSRADLSLENVWGTFKSFTEPVSYKPSLSSVKGTRSLQEYSRFEIDEDKVQALRDANLSDEEIDMWLRHKAGCNIPIKSSGVQVNPEIYRSRIQQIIDKIKSHQTRLKQQNNFSGSTTVSRLKIELERSLNQGRSDKAVLSTMLMRPSTASVINQDNSPAGQLKNMAEHLSNQKNPIPYYGDPYPNPWVPVKPASTIIEKLPPSAEFIGPKIRDSDLDVSDEVIFTNRLTIEEIRQLPKFASYSIGEPNKVLYVKNLGSTVKQEHLEHLFSRYQVPGDTSMECKLMTGKMRGQAFIQCPDTETATHCLTALNGYMLRGRPIIISYRREKHKTGESQ